VATLALGIGANTAIFTMVHAIILKPLPFRDPSRLLAVWDTYVPHFPRIGISSAELNAWQQEGNLFEQSAWYRSVPLNLNLSLPGTEAQEVHASVMSPALLPMLGTAPEFGHSFAPNEPPTSVLLSNPLWRSRFSSDRAVLGRAITLSGKEYTVAGVMPANFRFPDFAELWLAPGPAIGDFLTNPVRHGLGFVGRLRAGVTEAQATARLDTIARQLAAEHPRTSKGWGTRIAPLADDLNAKQRPVLWMLSGAVALVLLIACANVASLLLSRASGRRKEFAVRIALGANTWQLVRQWLAESLTLAALGAALGLVFARAALGTFAPEPVPLEPAVLAFLAAVSAITGILFGLAPASQILSRDLSVSIKGPRATGALIVAEFAMAMILVGGAGLLAKSLIRLLHVDPGFDPSGVLTLRLSVPTSRNAAELFRRIEDRIHELPGSPVAAVANALPIIAERSGSSRFHVPENPSSNLDSPPAAQLRFISPQYFRAMGVPIVSGREFEQRDLTGDGVIINQNLARHFWPRENPVGRRFMTSLFGPTPGYSTVLGVAGDVKDFGLDSEESFDLYFPGIAPRYLIVRTQGDPTALPEAVRSAIRSVDPDIPVSDVRTMSAIIAASSDSRRWTMLLLSAFAALAMLLAIIGIYGVTSWLVAQRTREIGIRMALGADAAAVRRDVLTRGMRLCGFGLAIGLAVSFALQRVAAKFVFEVSPNDPTIYAGAAFALLVTAALACYLPARRASRVDPSIALRSL
jgi:putative ABC transport system permease protein